jgi:hypothetical protein
MRVTFTRDGGRRYSIAIERERGPELVPRPAPGYDDHLPHDLAHYLVEEQFGLALGVFGRLAAGGGGMYTPAPADRSERYARTARRLAAAGRHDMGRSETLVYLCVSEWQRRTGRRATLPDGVDTSAAGPAELDRAVRRLDEVSRRWHALPPGGSLTFTWPAAFTVDPGGSRRGRRSARSVRPGRVRR